MRISVLAAPVLAAALFAIPAGAATNPKSEVKQTAQQAKIQARAQGWATQCASASRTAKPDCAVNQRVALMPSGKSLAAISIKIPSDTRKPMLVLQAPFGLYLPAGVSLTVDKDKPLTLPFQTCDNSGCYAAQPLSAALLKKLQTGENVIVKFQNQNRNEVSVPVPLKGFKEAYAKVK